MEIFLFPFFLFSTPGRDKQQQEKEIALAQEGNFLLGGGNLIFLHSLCAKSKHESHLARMCMYSEYCSDIKETNAAGNKHTRLDLLDLSPLCILTIRWITCSSLFNTCLFASALSWLLIISEPPSGNSDAHKVSFCLRPSERWKILFLRDYRTRNQHADSKEDTAAKPWLHICLKLYVWQLSSLRHSML
jgi:hypothetical protein